MDARSPRTLGVLVSATETAANDVAPVGVSTDMRSGVDLAETLVALGHQPRLFDVGEHFDADAAAREVDGCLLALHGPLGGSGRLQARMSAASLGFVGPSAERAATAYDKWRSREVLRWHNVPVPTSCVVSSSGRLPTDGPVRWPCVLKPRRGSFGQGHVQVASRAELAGGLARARECGAADFVLERHVAGIEVQVVLLHGEVLGSMQVDGDVMLTPPTLGETQRRGIHHLARRAADALGLTRGVCRVDVLVHPRDNEFVLEVEPLPPLHRESVVTRVARAAGLSYRDLIARLVEACPLPQPVARPTAASLHAS